MNSTFGFVLLPVFYHAVNYYLWRARIISICLPNSINSNIRWHSIITQTLNALPDVIRPRIFLTCFAVFISFGLGEIQASHSNLLYIPPTQSPCNDFGLLLSAAAWISSPKWSSCCNKPWSSCRAWACICRVRCAQRIPELYHRKHGDWHSEGIDYRELPATPFDSA